MFIDHSTHAEDAGFDELGDLGCEGRVLENLGGFCGILLERLERILDFRSSKDILDFGISHRVLSTLFLFFFALAARVSSDSGFSEEVLEFLVLRSKLETLLVSCESLVVFLHREVAVTLFGVRLDISGIKRDGLFQILKGAGEFHQLNIANTTVGVVLRILRASSD